MTPQRRLVTEGVLFLLLFAFGIVGYMVIDVAALGRPAALGSMTRFKTQED